MRGYRIWVRDPSYHAYQKSQLGRNLSIRAKALEGFERVWAPLCIQLCKKGNKFSFDDLSDLLSDMFTQDRSARSLLAHNEEDTDSNPVPQIHHLSYAKYGYKAPPTPNSPQPSAAGSASPRPPRARCPPPSPRSACRARRSARRRTC